MASMTIRELNPERDADDMLLVESAYVLGITAFWQGAFAAAR